MKRYRSLFALALVATLICATVASAANLWEYPSQQVGTTEVLTPTTATGITVPTGTQWMWVTIRSAGAHIEESGSDATTSSHYWPTGSYLFIGGPNELGDFSFIDSSDGTSTIYVTYFRRR